MASHGELTSCDHVTSYVETTSYDDVTSYDEDVTPGRRRDRVRWA